MKDLLYSLLNVLKTIQIIDIIDILLLTYIVYKAIKLIRETRAGQLIKGIMLLLITYVLCNLFEFKAITFILKKAIDVGLIAILIMFQPELRRVLEKVGRTSVSQFNMFGDNSQLISSQWISAIDEICQACEELSATTTGALIVVERKTKLGEQINTGILLNAMPTKELFGNIFYPKTPLHDGAVIIRDGIVLAAACFLPKPEREELINKKLGSRHRAAIGMSENSDAIIIVVSEETGIISIAHNGELTRNYNKVTLKNYLTAQIIPSNLYIEQNKKISKKKVKK